MNKYYRTLLTIVALSYGLVASAQDLVRFDGKPGSKMSIDGTSSFHDWTVETTLISGSMELDPSVVDSGKAPAAGKVDAKVQVTVFTRTLKSGTQKMDDVMHTAMKESEHRKIIYKLNELVLLPKTEGSPLKFDSKGDLTIAGITKPIQMQVSMQPMPSNRMKVSGKIDLKMSDFGIVVKPPMLSFGLIKVGDDVKLAFDWITERAATTAKAQ